MCISQEYEVMDMYGPRCMSAILNLWWGARSTGESSIPEKSSLARAQHVCVGGRSKQDSRINVFLSTEAKGRTYAVHAA
ncbi:uncharacterized protein LOC143902485 [Temnothorax americanus]|uniref:uncharacterized protein LOC143902485 n=1 Tax=Temnothorax americanus TaxID=1964332 RepID=UPI004067F5E5